MPITRNSDPTTDLLKRLMESLGPSLALFLDDSGIWSRPGSEELKLAIADLCTDLRSLFDRAGVLLDAQDVPAPQVEYPIRFTALHDISLEYLIPQLEQETRRQISAAESCSNAPGDAGDLFREARVTLQYHLDVLEQFSARKAASRAETVKPTEAT